MRTLISLSFFLTFSLSVFSQTTVKNLLCENLSNPIGIDAKSPRFSWQLNNVKVRGVKQTAYEINVTDEISKKNMFSSGKVVSDKSVMVAYAGEPLEAKKKYLWQVRVWDEKGKQTEWSSSAHFQMGILDEAQWKAQWINPGFAEAKTRPAIMFRKEFSSTKKVTSASIYVTAHGLYEAKINGKKVGDAYLTPGWTSYKKRLQYQVYDVSSLVANGKNAISVSVGNGWYRGYLAWSEQKNVFGDDSAVLLQLEITYSDGSSETIVSDGTWKTSTGEITYNEIYHGETIDARLAKKGWELPNYDDSKWSVAKTAVYPKNVLVATPNELVKKHEKFVPIKVFTTPKGEQVIDFGQNLVGWVMVKARGKAGDSIIIQHAEVLDKQGNFYIENYRAAKSTATYVLSGNGEEVFEPHFTFFGFRYIRIKGVKNINPADFTAVALYSDMPVTGQFTCSNPLINQLQHNIQWGQRGNFLDVPTDCPQRDERLGWTGDAQVFARTATFNMNVNNFFGKWLQDVAADQKEGAVPHVVPTVLGQNDYNSAGWADVATIVPWNTYLAYGDTKILETQYNSMKAYVESIRKVAKNDLWNKGSHFGDWLYYHPDNNGSENDTDKYLIAQCFYANSTQLLINTAEVLGKAEDVKSYTALLQKIKTAFIKEYMTPSGRLISNTQTAYVLTLNFDMIPEDLRAGAATRLVENIRQYKNHLTTGFLGTPYLCHVLTRFGYTDVAYTLLLQETYPSWLYPIKMGATTIWERWNGIKPDNSFEDAGMNSFNHYAYGAIGDWMYRVMAGLDTYEDGVGYKHIKIQPQIGGGFTNASASLDTYYGTAKSSWKIDADKITIDIEIPANTTANVFIPSSDIASATENNKPLKSNSEIKLIGTDDKGIQVQIGSGSYHFVAKIYKPKIE